jgi:hypothetical protein
VKLVAVGSIGGRPFCEKKAEGSSEFDVALKFAIE